jgi:hypothetical protein
MELKISEINTRISIKPYWADDTLGTNSPPAEVRNSSEVIIFKCTTDPHFLKQN